MRICVKLYHCKFCTVVVCVLQNLKTTINAYMYPPQIYKRDPRPRTPPRVMASSAMELQLGVFGFLLSTHTETNANKMRPRSSRAVGRFTRVYLHAQTAVHMHLTNHGYFDRGKNPNTPNLSPMPG